MAATVPAPAQESALEAANKKVAIDFYNKLLNEKDGAGAVALTADTYVNLYPGPRPGREGVVGSAEFLKQRRPQGLLATAWFISVGSFPRAYACWRAP